MGNVGDEFRFQTFVFQAFFYSSIKTVANSVDVLRHLFLIPTKLFFRDLVSEFPVCDPFQAIKEKFPSKSNFIDKEKGAQIQKKKQ